MVKLPDITTGYCDWMTLVATAWMKSVTEMFDIMHKIGNPVFSFQPPLYDFEIINEGPDLSSTLKDDFVPTITHELRTPLTSIRAISNILADNPDIDTAQRDRFVGVIVQETEKLTGLVEEVLDLAELELGVAEWHLSEVDLKEIIEVAVAAIDNLLNQNNIKLQIRLPNEVPPIIADRNRLIQVMLSLLSNAIKFCDRSSGWIGIRLQVLDDAVQVDVSDNGSGINSSHRQRISKAMNNGYIKEITAKEPQTTSIGLLISRHIVSHLGGDLWADNQLTYGAKFSFRLPYNS